MQTAKTKYYNDHVEQQRALDTMQNVRRWSHRGLLIVPVLLMMLAPISAMSEDSVEKRSPNCDTGPLHKTYGGSQWLVYSCPDNRTVVLISAPGNPAWPFIFAFYVDKKRYRLSGEGAGSQEASAAAFNELKAFSEKDIVTLIEQTKTVQRKEVK